MSGVATSQVLQYSSEMRGTGPFSQKATTKPASQPGSLGQSRQDFLADGSSAPRLNSHPTSEQRCKSKRLEDESNLGSDRGIPHEQNSGTCTQILGTPCLAPEIVYRLLVARGALVALLTGPDCMGPQKQASDCCYRTELHYIVYANPSSNKQKILLIYYAALPPPLPILLLLAIAIHWFSHNSPNMTLLALKEDRPTPKAVYNWRVYTTAAIASFASCMIGYDSAFIGTTIALASFKDEFGFNSLSTTQLNLISANIVSVYQAGAFWGSLFAYVSSYFLGRRKSLFLFSCVFILGAGLMLGANGDRGLGLIYAGRVLAGIGVGGASNMVPIYISELAPPAVRGRLVGIYELGWQIGGLVGFWINYGVNNTLPSSHKQWIIPFAVQLIPAGLLLVGACWIKESPRWLLSKGHREEGLRNLCWMRNLDASDIYIVEEVSYIDEDLERYRNEVGAGFFKPFASLKQKKVQWRFFLGSMLFLWQNGSGINAINYYSPTIFKSIGVEGTNASLLTTGVFGCVKTVFTFIWLL